MRNTRTNCRIRTGVRTVALAAIVPALAAVADVVTAPTTDTELLAASLHPTGLVITSVVIHNGVDGQFGTYGNFQVPPVTIHDGIVLSSGNVTSLGPLPEALLPDYDPASPPMAVNNMMVVDGSDGSTAEFNTYGLTTGNIENFYGCYDVAAIAVTFELSEDSPVKFDFIFGSVEFPYWTSSYTDAFLVFLDGLDPENQVTYDANGIAIQVGKSFAGLETTEDRNTAFSSPHAVIHHLTTTTERLSAGEHTLYFEVGDVNDHILDSAVFITNLRAEAGSSGTDPTDPGLCDGDLNEDDMVDGADLGMLLGDWGQHESEADLNSDDLVDGADLGILLGQWGSCR